MAEQFTIPQEMLDAATEAIRELRREVSLGLCASKGIAQVALEAAHVPALLERIAELEAQLAERSAQ